MREYDLYVVATPIGNLRDITLRSLDVLKEVDIIACEDTRHTKKLLDEYGINKRLISYHEFNEEDSSRGIIEEIKKGNKIALVSDAGMPGINDPGHFLINDLIREKISFTVLPGPSRGITALILSGFPSDEYSFLGFFPRKKKDKIKKLREISNVSETSIFYESPKRIDDTLLLIKEELPDRRICVVREISKLFEESKIFYGKDYKSSSIMEKGEFVLLIEGQRESLDVEDSKVIEYLNKIKDLGYSKKDSVNIVASLLDMNKNDVKRIDINY